MKILMSLVGLCLISSFAQAKLSVGVLNAELKQQNAGWKAKETAVSQLTEQQQIRMMGVRDYKEKTIDFRTIDTVNMSGTDSLDWRNKDGQNWVGPMMDQGNCGSCVAFATVGTLEVQMNIDQKLPWLNKQYSTQALFACGGGACEMGWWPSSAVDYLTKKGVPDEACLPYLAGSTGEDVACASACADSSQRSQKITSYSTPSKGDVDFAAVKEALKHGPLETTLTVYEDFMSYGSGVYKHVKGKFLGGHAVSIIGYDDAKRAWIIRNSWGTTWGEDGFGYVSYDDVSGVADETWGVNIGAQEGHVVMDVRDRDFVGGRHSFAVKSTYANTKSLDLTVSKGSQAVATATCAQAECGLEVDTTKLEDGDYSIVTTATLADGKKATSERKYLYVLNHFSPMKISYALQQGKLDQPLNGRVVFDVTTESGNAPMSKVQFFVKDASGKVVASKIAKFVVPNLTVGWRTNLIPNGTYEIYFVGTQATDAFSQTVESEHLTVTTQN